MKPTVGRVVLFHPIAGVTHAATIAHVHSDTIVNLGVLDQNGVAYNRTSVQLVQPDQAAPEFSPYCEWMPYQAEQVRKVLDLPVVTALPPVVPSAPRVTPTDLSDNIVGSEFVKHVSKSGQVLRWAVLTTRNGFAVAGKPSCAVSHENDDAVIGEKVALENAKAELWPLMGYELRSKLACFRKRPNETP